MNSSPSPKTLIVINGPTAIGKTALSIKLATHYDTEIISADSRQFYKEMNIGTAVPNKEELAAVPHHFIQHKSIHDSYNVGDYENEVIAKITELFSLKNVLILVGGSGLYIKAILEGMDEFPEIDASIREELNLQLTEKGISYLQNLLKQVDPDYYSKVDLNNPQRIIRALEVSIQTQKPYSSFLKKKQTIRAFQAVNLALNAPRNIIYDRINLRVDLMMKEGLLEEVVKLYPYKDLNALQTVGYKELFNYIDGIYPLEFAVSEIKKNTRRYAKRQLTWLRKDSSIVWIEYDADFKTIIDNISKKI
ncbi:tRNA (adenosine(37)-N6)-dimethylallyltransferase MiaA [Ascidiimonas sp. W6]|uniref:tRNA (adenosine(37)-N6)-dimethylallyltransferase MiaA n=1 Tax=Ascidiimonas meishanensis TaxID=3128903 RepID=UPI0030ECDC1B